MWWIYRQNTILYQVTEKLSGWTNTPLDNLQNLREGNCKILLWALHRPVYEHREADVDILYIHRLKNAEDYFNYNCFTNQQ